MNIAITRNNVNTYLRGLTLFLNQDEGRRLYLTAIEASNAQKNNHLKWLGELNYAREEILSKSEYIEFAMKAVSKIPDDTKYYNVNKLKTDVTKMYNKTKKCVIFFGQRGQSS